MQKANFKFQNKKIVVIGGGTGSFAVLAGLRKYFKNLTAIVTMADDGGSTGILREEFGILPTGDVRRALVALSPANHKLLAQLFNYRFVEGAGLKGHAFGNLMLTALERLTKNFESAITEAGKLLGVAGEVIPVTTQSARLVAELENGQVIKGEHNIDVPKHNSQLRIKKVCLVPDVKINPRAQTAIKNADLVIIGPGDLYTSLIPNLLVSGVPQALAKTKAKVVYIVNAMTKRGETNGFTASDFLNKIQCYAGQGVIDYVLMNKTKPSQARLRAYAEEGSIFVTPDLKSPTHKTRVITADLIRSRGFIRHDPAKIAALVKQLV